jgi:type VI secretion system protein ImpM
MMPSVDSAGRYFPLTLAIELAGRQRTSDWARQWWELSAQVAIAALESDLDASRFELALQEAFGGNASGASMPAGPALQLPSPGQSVWRIHPGHESPPSMVWSGLPRAASFDALFGCGADQARAPEASR